MRYSSSIVASALYHEPARRACAGPVAEGAPYWHRGSVATDINWSLSSPLEEKAPMSTAAQDLLKAFDSLPAAAQHEVAVAILRRAAALDAIPEAGLHELADELFRATTPTSPPMPTPQRSEVWLADLGRDGANRRGRQALVEPLKAARRDYRGHVWAPTSASPWMKPCACARSTAPTPPSRNTSRAGEGRSEPQRPRQAGDRISVLRYDLA
jgi:hypothetical protein